MASRAPWAPEEIAVLREHVADPDWMQQVRPKLAHRPDGSIRGRMMKLRAELNLVDAHDSQAYYNANAVNGSRALIDALLNSSLVK